MARFFTDEFPYTNLGDINLDWILDELKSLEDRVTALEARVDELEQGGVP